MNKPNFQLILDFTLRDISNKYRKSYLGMFWAIFTPLLTWAVYSAVFSGVLGLHRLPGVDGDKWDYIFSIFVGLSVYFFFSEILSGSPSYIASRSTFVKKVVFPLKVLVISRVLAASFSLGINLLLLIIFILIGKHNLSASILLVPVFFVPITLCIMGLAFFLASLGVFIPDIIQVTQPLNRIFFYATPIVYPLVMVPESFRSWLWLNPMTYMVESLRAILVLGMMPNWNAYGLFFGASVLVLALSYAFFLKLKSGFADVL
jgi:homopolymeric O-antigen transport system permease protein